MPATLGKRKRVTREELASPSSGSQESGGEDLRALFRRAFEAKFKPVDIEPVKKKSRQVEVEEEDEEEDSDWSGISSEDADGVEVVEHAGTRWDNNDKASKAETRAFMSAKPPTLSASATPKPAAKPADDAIEISHLKNDVELQSLLRESTLLSTHAPTYSTRTSAAPTRSKLTDAHLQSLGAKSSIFAQKKMPMSHRKGIEAKGMLREGKRRAEAKENGIVLEREKKERKVVGKRERGIGGPNVGRFKGGTLTLSRKDVASITRDGGGGGRGRGKGKRGKR
ncbi:hypothetical protein K458DRAFT_344923 [Lentithecium fluviatile CBS 122367]|uniref:Protein FAF1 n=1 Tax=Lentithecium fluviatile CBS 122367 TaxID=1168545 RepID=A0A6G1IRW1_9PLEO|nr:hypothetical protein K458DRAFT_344923 [Lentithecium fluviatile CBS 122367]